MDIDSQYQQVITDLKNDIRPQIKLDEESFKILFVELGNLLPKIQQGEDITKRVEKILCLLDHTQNHSPIFEGLLCKYLKSPVVESQLKIYTLAVTQRLIIQRRNFLGEMLPGFYLDTLEELLNTKNSELYEWTLRTIDETGDQGKKLIHRILKTRPRFLKMFNKHNQNSHDIIEMLMDKWGFNERR